ncbi:hypothetical protein L7F22_008972 [Adiantum nelumboides]|nr:hypothetical protein [Adiantum nelumboides]
MGTFGMSNVSSTTFSASTADVAAISNMKANVVGKLKEKQQCLEAIKISLDQSKTKRDEQVGLMRDAAKIIERLNKDMEELKLHKAGLVPNEEAMAKLETLIQIKKEALKDMGLDIEVHNLDNLGEEAAQLEAVVIGVYMLRCQHPYHSLCFVTTCKSASQCLFHGCEEPLKDALKLLAPGEANMDEHVGTEKDPMEGIFGSLVDGIAHSQARSSRKPNIDSMCGGYEDKNASQKQASEDTLDQQKAKKRAEKRADVVEAQGDTSKESAEVPMKPEIAMNKDVEDTEKSSEKPIEKDTTVNLSDEDADILISNVCGEILGCRKKRSNTEEHTTPKKKAKVASEPPKPTPRVKNTLTALLQNQEPAAAAPSTSHSTALNTLAALQAKLQTEKLQRQLLVSGFMSQTAQHEAKVKQLEEELAKAKAELAAVGSLASTSHIQQAETHVPTQLPQLPEMPEFQGTEQEEQQRPAPGDLDIREEIEQEIEGLPEGPAKEYLMYEKKVMQSATLAFLQPEEQIKDFGNDFLPLPLMRHESILWKEKMRPTVPRNEDGGYEDDDVEVLSKEEQETVGQKTKQPSIPTRRSPKSKSPLQDDDDADYDVADDDDDDAKEQDKVGQTRKRKQPSTPTRRSPRTKNPSVVEPKSMSPPLSK